MIAKTQPLLVAWLATLLGAAIAKYTPGLHLSDDQVLAVAGGLFTVGTWVARRYVTPLARPRLSKDVPLVPAPVSTQGAEAGFPPVNTAGPGTSRAGQVYDHTKQPPTR